MRTFFRAKYFDAIDNMNFQVKVHATQRFVVIDVMDEENHVTETIYWEHEGIKRDAFPNTSPIVRLYFGASYLEVPSTFLNEVKSKFRFAPYLSSSNAFLANNKSFLGIGIVLVILAMLVVLFTYLTENFLVNLIPPQTEVKIGEMLRQQIVQQEHLKIDTARTTAVNAFYTQIHFKSDDKVCIWVVKSDELNAFALPGGNIFVYSALLDKIKSPEQLVALLGHETGHIQLRHSLRSVMKNVSTYALISVIFGDLNGAFAAVLSQLSKLNELSYSRENESDADKFAFEIMTQNHLNPKGMLELFNILKTKDQTEDIPGVLLTHPKLEKRIQWVNAAIAKKEFTVKINPGLNRSFSRLSPVH